MSAAQTEAEFTESVFDDTAPGTEPKVEAEAPKGDGDAKVAPPLTQIEETAKKAGWSGKDEWKGDPADWLEAPEFILKAVGDVLPSMRKSLEKANEEISGLKKSVKASIQHLSKARQEGYEQRGRELQAELEAAANAGNVADVKAITADIVALDKEISTAPKVEQVADELPELTAWKEENPWFGRDKPLTAATTAIADEAVAEGYSGKALVKEVDRRVREAFPEKFKAPVNPNRDLPGAVEGAGGSQPRSRGKTFSDMPKEHQDMCADMMKLSPKITKESYAREYFSEEKR